MLSKNRLKFIKSLQIKKFRKEHGQFLVEGAKSVSELIESDYKIHTIFVTPEYANCWKDLLSTSKAPVELVSEDDLAAAGTFESNNAALAIVEMKENKRIEPKNNQITLVLDEIKDPGNLGTIIRIADWYGVENIICSENTVDFYNPKVISATMGSFTRVNFFYTNLQTYLSDFSDTIAIYGAALDGENIHQLSKFSPGFLIMGNESNGISDQIKELVNHTIRIPGFGKAESLNVGVATAVLLDNFRRTNK